MIRFLLEPPLAEPVTLAEAKAHLRVAHAEEDGRIAGLLAGARSHIESICGLVLMPQRWRLILDLWPAGGSIRAGFAPLAAIHAARLIDPAGAAVPIDLARLWVRPIPPNDCVDIDVPPLPLRPRRGIEIDVDAGFADGAVPADLREAILRLAARWYGERGDAAASRPADIAALLAPYRRVRL